jgi:2-keto-4-pentenoate hydratase/2-oxohepta-3-ene-1,7-dioic acid hydratase in catechol pathway
MAGHFVATGRKIVAIGRNYAAHAAELKNAGARKIPISFAGSRVETQFLPNRSSS